MNANGDLLKLNINKIQYCFLLLLQTLHYKLYTEREREKRKRKMREEAMVNTVVAIGVNLYFYKREKLEPKKKFSQDSGQNFHQK